MLTDAGFISVIVKLIIALLPVLYAKPTTWFTPAFTIRLSVVITGDAGFIVNNTILLNSPNVLDIANVTLTTPS